MLKTTTDFPTSTLKCLLENTELAEILFKNFPLLEDDQQLKSDKQLISNELSSKVGWNSSAFLGPNLWDKDQLYSASGNGLNVPSTSLHNEKNLNSTNSNNSNFKVENIDIDEFLCENNLNLNDIESFSNHFENVEQTTSNSPNQNQDNLILHSPMQAAPAKSPADDSISRQSSNSSRKYSQDETSNKNGNTKQSKKSRKAQLLSKQFVPDELKDEKYWARRRKNNLAAKRSRDARRMKENQIALRADYLERESDQLKKQVEDLKRENQKLKIKLIQYESKIQQ
jgi:leukemia factor-related protein